MQILQNRIFLGQYDMYFLKLNILYTLKVKLVTMLRFLNQRILERFRDATLHACLFF